MKTVRFKCTLLTDIVLNEKSGTEGNQRSLDFIPGNIFLGIAAKIYTTLSKEESLQFFHADKVRFSDAHPALDDKRSLHVPASMYYPKLKNKNGFYISHEVQEYEDDDYKDFQPKQCRSGYYIFENGIGRKVKVEKTFAIKSAYDRDKRRSKDNKMYGYESLRQGSSWIFEVAADDDIELRRITEALEGNQRIGRSRTAQYGLVSIKKIDTAISPITSFSPCGYSLVYADSRLIFLDEYGLPTFQPTAKDLGFQNGIIDWGKSQVRTFQYSPWNNKRQARDTERCGVEKGSVFVVRGDLLHSGQTFVGKYQNEGFGKIIINPAFLEACPDSNGKSKYILEDTLSQDKENHDPISRNAFLEKLKREHYYHDPLITYLVQQLESDIKEAQVYKLVNQFVENEGNNKVFLKKSFSSQWGSIRNIAVQKDKTQEERHEAIIDFITRGVAKDKWAGDALKLFRSFIDDITRKLDNRSSQLAIINLAAEMAKKAGRK